jgi:predicted MFS family arabinose efflux permease
MKTIRPISKSSWTLLLIAWLAMATGQIITFSYGMMLPNIMKDFSISYGVVGLVGSVASIVAILITIPVGMVASRFNPKFFLPAIILFTAVGTLIFGMAPTLSLLYVGRIVAAIATTGLATGLVIVKMQRVPLERMGEVNGVENFIGPLGQIIATLIMAQILVLVGGWRNVYTIIGIVLVAAVVMWLIVYKEDNQFAPQPVAQDKPTGLTEAPLKTAFKQKTFWLLALGWPGTTIVWIAMFYYWPSYATAAYGLKLSQVGLVLSFIPIFSAIASLTSPIIAKKLGYDKPLIWPWGFILPLAYFGMLQSSNIVLLCVFAAIAGYGAYCFVPLAFTTLYKLGLHPKVVTIGTSMVMTGVSLGAAMGSGIVGSLIGTLGIHNALAVCCLTPIIWGVLTLFIPERGRKYYEQLAKGRQAASQAQA